MKDTEEKAGEPDTEALLLDQATTAAVREYLQLVQTSQHDHIEIAKEGPPRGAIFKDVKVSGGDAGIIYQDTVTTMALRPFHLVRPLFSNQKPAWKEILHGIDGIVNEGEMLLVLGRPGSGCTTLLKTLAGITDSFHGWSGRVTYEGLLIDTIKKKFRGDVVYNAEGDVHFPFLTVLQTLSFAVKMKTLHKIPKRSNQIQSVTNSILRIFGLEDTTSTLIGNDFVAGVSGGERKRVSLAEVLSTHARVTIWDNSTQGLDSSNSVRFGEILHEYSKTGNNIAMAALYQASDDLVGLFDKVTILHEGQQIFFGTIEEAEDYFSSLGFERSKRQSLSEFFISVTETGLRSTKEGWQDRVPRSVDDFVQCWKASTYWASLEKAIVDQQDAALGHDSQMQNDSHEQKKASNKPEVEMQEGYILSRGAQLSATLQRAVARLGGSAFYNTPDTTQGFFSRQGVIFFGILFNTIQTLGEVVTQYARRPIVQKQQGFAMYHPGIDAVSSLISLWPLKIVSVLLFDLVLYFMANLKREPGTFFIFFLFTYFTTLMMSALFRFIAAVNKHEATAMSIVGVLILPLVIYTGYVIPKTSMHPWFKWITYINPLSYSFEALIANEFHGREVICSTLIPSGPAYQNISHQNQVCPVTGSTPGSIYVSGDLYIAASFDYYHSHIWRNFGILIAFFVFFMVAYGLAVEFVPQVEKGRGDVLIWLRHWGSRRNEKSQPAVAPSSADELSDSQGFARLKRSDKSFSWNHLDYDIHVKDGTKTLLTGIHGYVKPGTMTALIGESGAGKTTLLNVLAQRTETGVVRGEILINGKNLGKDFKQQTGFVESQDVHMSESTVRETLRFSAQLRQPLDVSDKEKNEYVEEIIKVLEMQDYADAVIGVPGSGLNLEQRKRMTVGIELVAKPSLIFLDEPTSGLDSQSSWSIILCLRKLADSGQAILCTIHQPNILRVMGSQVENTEWADIWQNSDEAKVVEQDLASLGAPKQPSKEKDAKQDSSSISKTSLFHQYQLVQTRSFQFYWRSPVYIHGKVILNLAAGLFLGFTYFQEKNSAQGLQNKMFATFSSLILSAPLMNQIQPRFFQVRDLYKSREEPSKMYHWSIFAITLIITEMITNLITGTLYFIPWFFAVGFSHNFQGNRGRSAYMWIMFMMYELWVSTFALLIAALAPNAQIGTLLIPMSFVFVALFCGVLQPLSQLVQFWHFVHYASPFTWLIEYVSSQFPTFQPSSSELTSQNKGPLHHRPP
ncbi:hypothetical protein G7Y89_g11429 [Cudoniella acicularis]|uniref:ABC transporter domain-containing protein n=1 Tax=Cudoniella acicularis TaxID=354080 RepID=A0A8H4VYA6_9HELO|nr:hypothetical protein G7Y89_g11429 [Cudoniella acicularis]